NPCAHSIRILRNSNSPAKERDQETELDYFMARYLDADVGRFLQADPLMRRGPQWSPYSYSFDNPVYFLDKDGNWPDPTSLVALYAAWTVLTSWGHNNNQALMQNMAHTQPLSNPKST